MRNLSICPLLIANVSLFLVSATAQEKKPVPDKATQKATVQRIHSVFEDEFAATDRPAKAKLAKKLVALARQEEDDSSRFTLYREAIRMASEGGNAGAAMNASDAMAQEFAVNGPSIKQYSLSILAKGVLPLKQAEAVADAAHRLASEQIARNDYAGAKKTLQYGFSALRRLPSSNRLPQLRSLSKHIDGFADQFKAVAQHSQTLKNSPTDPTANFEVGRFECFVKGNWKKGLQHLTRCGDESLKQLALQTLKGSGDAQTKFNIANDWWKQAAALEGIQKERVFAFAGKLYQEAIPGLTGLSKATAEKRVKEGQRSPITALPKRQKTVNLLELIDAAQDFQPREKWAINKGTLQCTRGHIVPKVIFPYQPPQEYDVAFSFAQPSIRNPVGVILPTPDGKANFAVLIGGSAGREIELSSSARKYLRRFPRQIIQAGSRYAVVVKIRKEGIMATINGTMVINLKTDFSDLRVGAWHRTPDVDKLVLFADDPAFFHNVRVTEITGTGSVTRFPKEN